MQQINHLGNTFAKYVINSLPFFFLYVFLAEWLESKKLWINFHETLGLDQHWDEQRKNSLWRWSGSDRKVNKNNEESDEITAWDKTLHSEAIPAHHGCLLICAVEIFYLLTYLFTY